MEFGTRVLLCGGIESAARCAATCTTSTRAAIGLRARRELRASFGALHVGERIAQPAQPGTDPRLRGPERDVLPFRDLASAQSPEPGHHDGALLLLGQGGERGAQPHDVAVQRDDVTGISSRRRRRDGDEIVGIDRDRSSDSQRVDGCVAGDRQQPG